MPRWEDENRTSLEKLRVEAGYTREEAAVLLHMGAMTLFRYEKGKTDITFSLGEKMAEIYNVSFEAIHQAALQTRKFKKKENDKIDVIRKIQHKRIDRKDDRSLIADALAENDKSKNLYV